MTGADVRKMSTDEMKIELGKLRGKLYELRTKRVSETVEDTSQYGKVRKDVARILTEQRARSMRAGGTK